MEQTYDEPEEADCLDSHSHSHSESDKSCSAIRAGLFKVLVLFSGHKANEGRTVCAPDLTAVHVFQYMG